MEQMEHQKMGILRSGERSCASDILNWLADIAILPDIKGVNKACLRGHLDVLKFLAKQAVLPNVEGANWACLNGHLAERRALLRERCS